MNRRSGFTITEMLVSMALILFMMAILSEAFVTGLGALRHIKAVGDLDAKLRGAITMLCHDLEADHFDDQPLSRQILPPLQGFFRVQQGTPPILEGIDSDNIPSTRSSDSVLHFSVNTKAGNLQNLVSSLPLLPSLSLTLIPSTPPVPPNYRAQWAEVGYFLRATGSTTTAGGGTPLQLYSLHRRQRLLYSPQPGLPLNLPIAGLVPSLLWDVSTGPLFVNTPLAVVDPINRPLLTALIDDPNMSNYWGADLVLTDVLSFEVRVSTGGEFMHLASGAASPLDPALSLINSPPFTGLDIFDTFTTTNVTVKAMRIVIRIWDPKTLKTRQVTIVQNM